MARKPVPELEAYRAYRQRDVPGRGAALPDDGIPGHESLKIRSIPNVPTERLERRQAFLHGSVHTLEGINQYDDTRRSLVVKGVTSKMISHELDLRGRPKNGCKFCE